MSVNRLIKRKKINNSEDEKTYVLFDDERLYVIIGKWLHILPSNYPNSIIKTKRRKSSSINSDFMELIEDKFRELLKQLGFSDDELCILEDYNETKDTFIGHFFNADKKAEFSLSCGEDELNEISITIDGCTKRYYYCPNSEKLTLAHLNKTVFGQRKYYSYTSQFIFFASINDDKHKASIEVVYPSSLEDTDKNVYIDTKFIELVLSGITFPVRIEDLCTKLADTFKCDLETIPEITITSYDMHNNESTIKDMAQFANGEFKKLIITKNGKTISLDSFDNWSHQTQKYVVTNDIDEGLTFSIKHADVNELDIPATFIQNAIQDIDETREFSLSLLKK